MYCHSVMTNTQARYDTELMEEHILDTNAWKQLSKAVTDV